MKTDEDVTWLRERLTGHDPADPGRAVVIERQPQSRRRHGTAWTAAALAAAAVVAAIVIPVTLSSRARTSAPGSGGGQAATSAAKPTPAPRAGYDHLRWQEFDGDTLTTTTQWWWNGVSGRELKTDQAGRVVSDVTLALPPAPGRPQLPDPTGAPATPAPTSGVSNMADNFPGTVPANADQLRTYLGTGSADPEQVVSILIQRVLDPGQMAALVSIVKAMPMTGPPTDAVAPDGRRVQILHPRTTTAVNCCTGSTVLNQSGTSVVGTRSESDGHTYWRLLSLAEISATTR